MYVQTEPARIAPKAYCWDYCCTLASSKMYPSMGVPVSAGTNTFFCRTKAKKLQYGEQTYDVIVATYDSWSVFFSCVVSRPRGVRIRGDCRRVPYRRPFLIITSQLFPRNNSTFDRDAFTRLCLDGSRQSCCSSGASFTPDDTRTQVSPNTLSQPPKKLLPKDEKFSSTLV